MTYPDARSQCQRFTDMALAQTYAEQERNRHIVLGGDGEILVGTYRAASALERMGHTMVSTFHQGGNDAVRNQ